MSEGNKTNAQSEAQAGQAGEAEGVGAAVGGVRSSSDIQWLDIWATNPETRAYLEGARRDAACSHATQKRKGAGDGPKGIATPTKLQNLQRCRRKKSIDGPLLLLTSFSCSCSTGREQEQEQENEVRNTVARTFCARTYKARCIAKPRPNRDTDSGVSTENSPGP